MAKFITKLGRKDASEARAAIWMATDQPQKQKAKGGGGGEDSGDKSEGGQKLEKKGEELKEEMDSLMDEIDSVLEENAEEFVKNYVQRGGE